MHGAILLVAALCKQFTSENENERPAGFDCFSYLSFDVALAALNLISLWVDPDNSVRIILLSISLYAHFEYVRELVWYVPANGDVVPDIREFMIENIQLHSLDVSLSIISIVNKNIKNS